MGLVTPDIFDLKDLFIDVRLDAFVNGNSFDYTGRQVYTIGFFEKNIGFGITNIDLEVNTSLQPVIEITFKDLYGNTFVGGQFNEQGIDYSSLLSDITTKFKFSFKGYLGKQVTWLLVKRNHSISFNPEDGSFEIKVKFLPNQWGFFSDLPFKYLFAVKKLRKNVNQTTSQQNIETIFDIINIGKKLDLVKQETTDKYNKLYQDNINVLNDLLTNIISGQLSLDFKLENVFDGKELKGVSEIRLLNLTTDPDVNNKTVFEDKAKSQKGDQFRRYVFSKITINGEKSSNFNRKWKDYQNLADGQTNNDVSRVTKALNENIKNIQEQINAETFQATKTIIAKNTISEVMRILAGNAAYLMGRILQAGLNGKQKYGAARLANGTIRESYPLAGKKDNDKPYIEGPAYNESNGIDQEGCEMAFVNEFINAVIDGIVEAQAISNQGNNPQDIAKYKGFNRVSNFEILQGNPYRPNESNIVENMLMRSAIIAFMTRSNDPNLPGDYGNNQIEDRDSDLDNIRSLAESDINNIDETILGNVDPVEMENLKKTCLFIDKMFQSDGSVPGYNKPNTPISNDVLNFRVLINTPAAVSQEDATFLNGFISTCGQLNNNLSPYNQKLEELINVGQITGNDFGSFNSVLGRYFGSGNLRNVNRTTLQSEYIVNNGLPWFYTNTNLNEYYYIAFEEDALERVKQSQGITVATLEEKSDEDAPGLIVFDRFKNDDGENLDTIDGFNSAIEDKRVVDYKQLSTNTPINADVFFGRKFTSNDTPESIVSFNEESGSKIGAMVYAHNYDAATFGDDDSFEYNHPKINDRFMVFGLFLYHPMGRSQRVALKSMAVKLLEKIRELENKKLQLKERLISQKYDSDEDIRDVIYKQFHNLYYAWETVLFTDDNTITSSDNNNIALDLEALYGGTEQHVSINEVGVETIEDQKNGCFLYDFPLQRIRENSSENNSQPINVKHSVINVESLNSIDNETTILNAMYNLCTKNNFMFIPIPGYPGFLNVKSIYSPSASESARIVNFFCIMFMPTPESRPLTNKTFTSNITSGADSQKDIKSDAFLIRFGSTDNQIVKKVKVSTDESKVTAESISMLQDLTDNKDVNKSTRADCSVLDVMAGRSYKSTIEVLGNAQIFPMQFFFLEKLPLFDGLYMVIKVNHSIANNSMNTTFEGIRMRFNPGDGYIATPPITLEQYEDIANKRGLDSLSTPNFVEQRYVGDADGTLNTTASYLPTNVISNLLADNNDVPTDSVIVPTYLSRWKLSDRFQKMLYKNTGFDTISNSDAATREVIIQNMNIFIRDVLEPFAKFLFEKDPIISKKVTLSNASRSYNTVRNGQSQHTFGQAIDIQTKTFDNIAEEKMAIVKLYNYILDFHALNPSLEYGQLLMETSNPNKIWIHWSYRQSGNQKDRFRMANHKRIQAPMNTTGLLATSHIDLDSSLLRNYT